ncbi:MAG: DUF4832 domain-containing protein [Verrucomicrobia bacterium]|nr:DUF4832 domain-containing protein [Verrucomicrobiota bacterium]
MKSIAAVLLAASTVCIPALATAREVVLTPAPATNLLLNPGKGWSVMGHATWQPPEVLELAGMGVSRFDWQKLEPREGEFDFAPVDKFLESWGKLGKVCNLGVMCANTHSGAPEGSATPLWVFAAGAKKIEIDLDPKRPTTGTPGHKTAPVFDDPVFLAKFGAFLRAFAARYDGDPRIALYDIRSYGNWGEAHMSPFGGKDIAPEMFRRHIQMHLDVFKKTRLCLSRNAHLGRYSPLKDVMDWAVLEKRIAPRRDGICGNSDGRETAIGLGIAPGVFELFGDYPFMKDLGWWDGRKDAQGCGFTLDACVENGKPTWVDLGRGGKSGLRMLQENRPLIARLTHRIGYHFHLQRIAYATPAGGRAIDLELTVTNRGVAPVYIPCAVAVSLLGPDNRPAATAWPGAFRPSGWMPGQAVTARARVSFPGAGPGTYRLALAITRKPGDPAPYIRLGTQLPDLAGWYDLGSVVLPPGPVAKRGAPPVSTATDPHGDRPRMAHISRSK